MKVKVSERTMKGECSPDVPDDNACFLLIVLLGSQGEKKSISYCVHISFSCLTDKIRRLINGNQLSIAVVINSNRLKGSVGLFKDRLALDFGALNSLNQLIPGCTLCRL